MDLFELEAILRLNTTDFDKGVEDAEKSGTGLINRIANTWTRAKSKFQTVSTILKPVTDLVEDVVDKYSNYQQLVGGVEKLFESSAKTVATNARNAFRTAGMSMNDYMEMAVNMSASLIQGLAGDTDAAADMVDMAIQDMADNVNTFGTSMDQVKNVYSQLSRGTYTNLEFLSLGYSGSAKEMHRLMQDAAALNEEFANSAVFGLDENGHLNASYADMIRAIHIIQENMGVTGTTQREAANTISGSKASMSALWDNLKTLMGDPNATKEEIDAASEEFAGAIGKYVENITPIIVTALRSLLEAGKDLFPELARVIGEMLPPWLQSGLELIGTMISGIFGIVQDIASHLEALPRGMGISRAAYIAEFGWQQGNEYFEEKEKISGKSGALGDITPEEYRKILAADAVVGSSYRTEEEAAENAKNFNEFVAQEAANKIAESTDKTNEDLDILNKTLSEVMATQAKERGLIAPPEQYVRQNDDGTYSKVMVTVDGDVEMEHYQDLNSAIASLVKTITTMGGLDSLPSQYRPKTQVVDNSPNHAKGLWDVPYDDYYARLHRGEMVLTASEARDYREGNGGLSSAVVAAIEGMRNDLQNLQIVVGKKVFGQTVVDYSGKRMSGYIGKSEDKTVAGYGWG